MADYAIEIDRLTKRFGKAIVLAEVSLQIPKGSITALLGPTDAGKTTLLRCLTGNYHMTSGSARVMGLDVARESMQVRRAIGFAPETPFFDRTMTPESTVRFSASFSFRSAELDEVTTDALAATQFTGKSDVLVSRIKEAARARLALAQAYAPRPPVLLLDMLGDELDPVDRDEVFDTLRDLQRRSECTVLFTTRLADAAENADAIAFLIKGRLVRHVQVADILAGSPYASDPRRAIEEVFKQLLRVEKERDAAGDQP